MSEEKDDAGRSPDFLALPTRGLGRRINEKPIAAIVLVGGLLGSVAIYTLQARSQAVRTGGVKEGQYEPQESGDARSLLQGAQIAGVIEAAPEPTKVPVPEVVPALWVEPETSLVEKRPALAGSESQRRWEEEQSRERERRRKMKQQALESALGAEPMVQLRRSGAPAGAVAQMNDLAGERSASADPNLQGEKRAFLERSRMASAPLVVDREPPISPYQLTEGTVIPAVLLSAINSDLPGEILGQVAESVYDTATGRHVVIPQGTKLVGTYQSQLSQGQARVLVAWRRLIYPDASSVDLGSMPGTDQEGAAGFHDQVNNHLVRVFGSALLLSAISAGLQLSQPQPQADSPDVYTSQQIAAAAVGQQLGELGQEMSRRGMEIQPTLKIRAGYRFNVMVTRDLVLEPWGEEP